MIYCVKCKEKTETNDLKRVKSANNQSMLKGICAICGTKKSTFIKSGKGFDVNSLINNLPVELHLFAEKGEDIPEGSFNNQQKYSYCGPGTRYEQRDKEGYQGINELDKMCKLHDQFYNENVDTKTRNVSDLALAHRANEIVRNPIYDNVQRKDASFIARIMGTKAKLGLGIKKSKN